MRTRRKLPIRMIVIVVSLSIYGLLSFVPLRSDVMDSSNTVRKSTTVQDSLQQELQKDSLFCEEGVNNHDTVYTPESARNGWSLIWQDEFNGHCLDPHKWNVEDWAAKKNNELQFYTPRNVYLKDGALRLLSQKETYDGRQYTSGAVHTKDKFDMLYGKVEMRAKLPAGQGIFPAFWMMTDKEQTWLPEIDIMEMLGHQPNEVWMVMHTLTDVGELRSQSFSHTGEDFSKDYHTFGIEWTPDSITWLIDHVERFQLTQHVPDEKMYLYLNTAIGGDWPGSPDQTTIFPAYYDIDYVRVFKKVE